MPQFTNRINHNAPPMRQGPPDVHDYGMWWPIDTPTHRPYTTIGLAPWGGAGPLLSLAIDSAWERYSLNTNKLTRETNPSFPLAPPLIPLCGAFLVLGIDSACSDSVFQVSTI